MSAKDAHWLETQMLASARRLAARDPRLLSAVGRSLRDDAIALIKERDRPARRQLRLITNNDRNE